ncbi:DNA-directed RNA polymerase subunit omega [uncultured Oscillibacter sp.]|uniref:DNA-directed RNA polymerase subunit omega n=2 Tax=uncultured Oscillibacter sp. TaxID=876091 RepID=UPI0025D55B21|nr:DNA-directed RNA polymerase subunit omega [uncultured Oscillibacter sp.]
MMLYPAMDKLTSYVPNRYMLVNVVARRARQIAEAAEAAGEPLDEKPVTLAIHEVAEGRLEAGNANLTADEDTAE